MRLVLTALLLACAAWAQDAAALYRQGVDRQRQGDLAGAAESYRRSLDLDGSNVAARSNLGAAFAALGRYDEAVAEYKQALTTAPEQVRPMLERNLALAWYKSGRLEEAAELLISLHDSLLAADCFLQLGEPARALALLEPMSAQSSGDKAFAYLLGMAYLKTGKTAEAQRALDPILKDESSAEGSYALGMAMFTSRDYPAAVKAFARAIATNAALPHIESYYGQALLFTGDSDAALAAFSKQISSDNTDYEANYESGLILARRAKHAEAEPLLRRAVLLRPKSAGAHLALAESLVAQAKDTAARKELELTISEWPEFGAAHERLAAVYAKSGMTKESLRERSLAAKFAAKAEPNVGLKTGSLAPKFLLKGPQGGATVDITSPTKGRPTVLVFGSYSCPNFRKASPVLNELAQSLAQRVSFLQVYIREAHSTDQWQSTINDRENVQLAPASTSGAKQEYAMMCQRKLHLRFPAVVDGLDDAAEKAYTAWPSRVYVIAADGRVQYSSGLAEDEFDKAALESAIRSVLRPTLIRPGSPGRP